ncbi:MAG TPA: M23 family metallopeptidase [Amoebophilaceae bacterium]|nr:M23 family metallopeptidase [Amoebophilaceae bacterium]
MRETKYYYNPNTCSYERVQTSIASYLLRLGMVMLFSVLIAAGIVKHYIHCRTSPREAELLETNEKLKAYYHVVQKKVEKSTALLTALQERDDTLYRVLLNAPPLSSAERNAGIGGVDKYAHLSKETLIAQTLSKIDQLTSRLMIQKKSFEHVNYIAKKTASRWRSMPSLPPVSKKDLKRISAPFGMRRHPIYGVTKMHKGVDFAAKVGTPIYAAADGHVKTVKSEKKGYGKYVVVEHGNGFQTLYGHMNSFLVKEKQRVTRGQQIGTVGNTGDSTAPHLHYTVYYNSNPVNPVDYFVGELTPAEYEAVRKQAANQNQALCSNF